MKQNATCLSAGLRAELHQHFRMATDGATFSLLLADVRMVSTVLPGINKMQFVVSHISRLPASVMKIKRRLCWPMLTSQLKQKIGHGTQILQTKDVNIVGTAYQPMSTAVKCTSSHVQQYTLPLNAVWLLGSFISQNGDQTTYVDIMSLRGWRSVPTYAWILYL